MPDDCIYMDNHATTRVDPRVVEAMLPYFTQEFGNAGSVNHRYGRQAAEAIDSAQASIAAAIGASEREIIFTSGATEGNNLALRGVAERAKTRNHLISATTEHPSVLDPLQRLAQRGFEVTLLAVTPSGEPRAGWLDPERVADALRDETLLVSVMLANNEIGTIASLAEIAAICQQRGVLLHCDATQAVGKMAVDVRSLGVDLMSFTAHKIYGPKGIGALYVCRQRRPLRISPQIDGGGQQQGLRSGTLNTPGIVGFAKALELCLAELPTEAERLRMLRERLYQGIVGQLDAVTLNGPTLDEPQWRLPGNLDLGFALVDGEALMLAMERLAVSSGSACTSVKPEPSHVLRALGLSEDAARASLRFGLGRFNTPQEVDIAIGLVVEAVRNLRKHSSLA